MYAIRSYYDVGDLRAADTDALHPLQVLGDPLAGNVPSRPVPPDARPGFLGRMDECLQQAVAFASEGR